MVAVSLEQRVQRVERYLEALIEENYGLYAFLLNDARYARLNDDKRMHEGKKGDGA